MYFSYFFFSFLLEHFSISHRCVFWYIKTFYWTYAFRWERIKIINFIPEIFFFSFIIYLIVVWYVINDHFHRNAIDIWWRDGARSKKRQIVLKHIKSFYKFIFFFVWTSWYSHCSLLISGQFNGISIHIWNKTLSPCEYVSSLWDFTFHLTSVSSFTFHFQLIPSSFVVIQCEGN